MKKFVVYVLCVIVCFGSVSCGNQEIEECQRSVATEHEVEDQEALLALQQEIALYNAQELGIKGRDSKGWFKRFMKKVMIVLGADAMGAMVGSVPGSALGPIGTLVGGGVGAVSASSMAAVGIRKGVLDLNLDPYGNNKPYAISLDTVLKQRPTILFRPDCMKELVPRRSMVYFGNHNDLRTDSLGYLHNVSLMNVNSRNPQWFESSYVAISRSATNEFMKKTNWGVYSHTFNELHYKTYPMVGKIVDAANKSADLDDFCKRITFIYPQMKGKTEVLCQAILGLGQVDEQELNSRAYMEKLLEYVENSNVDKKTKLELRIGIVVAHASSKLWNSAAFEAQ